MLTYEKVILSTLNFHIRPPIFLILKHMQSILTMIDKSLDDILDNESYNLYKQHLEKTNKEKKKYLNIKRKKI